MKVLADLHVHSLASGHAYSTIEEIAAAAAGKGMEMVAVCDHGPGMPGGPHPFYFANLWVLPPVIHGVRVLAGAETNIIDENGTLDLQEYYLRKLDIVLAGLHSPCLRSMSVKKNTQALVKALENPLVDIAVHPGNPEFPVDKEELVRAAKDLNKALELNNSSFRVRKGSHESCAEIADLIQKHGTMVSISSDAHFSADVGNLSDALRLAQDACIPVSQIINLNAARVEQFLKQRGKHA